MVPNKWQVFRHITIPYLRPMTIFLVLTSIISGFQLFDEPYLLFSTQQGNSMGGPGRILYDCYDVFLLIRHLRALQDWDMERLYLMEFL